MPQQGIVAPSSVVSATSNLMEPSSVTQAIATKGINPAALPIQRTATATAPAPVAEQQAARLQSPTTTITTPAQSESSGSRNVANPENPPRTDVTSEREWSRLQNAFQKLKGDPASGTESQTAQPQAVQRQTSMASAPTPLFGTTSPSSQPSVRRRTQITEGNTQQLPTAPFADAIQSQTDAATAQTIPEKNEQTSHPIVTQPIDEAQEVAKPQVAIQRHPERQTASSAAATIDGNVATFLVASQKLEIPATDRLPTTVTAISNNRTLADEAGTENQNSPSQSATAMTPPVPLQSVWPVQRVTNDDSFAIEKANATNEIADAGMPIVLETVRHQMEQKQSDKSTESKIDIILPRRPRPGSVVQQIVNEPEATKDLSTDSSLVSAKSENTARETSASGQETSAVSIQRTQETNLKKNEEAKRTSPKTVTSPASEPAKVEKSMIKTAIGPLPADLWTLIDEPTPAPSNPVSDHGESSKKTSTENDAVNAQPVIDAPPQSSQIMQRDIFQTEPFLIEAAQSFTVGDQSNTEKPDRYQSVNASTVQRSEQNARSVDLPIIKGQNEVNSGGIQEHRTPHMQAIVPARLMNIKPVRKVLTTAVSLQRQPVEQEPSRAILGQTDQSTMPMPTRDLPSLQNTFSTSHTLLKKQAVDADMTGAKQQLPVQHSSDSIVPTIPPLAIDDTASESGFIIENDDSMRRLGSAAGDQLQPVVNRQPRSIAEIQRLVQHQPLQQEANIAANSVQRTTQSIQTHSSPPPPPTQKMAETATKSPLSSSPSVDIDALANQVYRQLKRKLVIERERLR